MFTFLLWCVLLFFCWPIALIALVLYPIVWLLLLPFRILGIAVEGVFELAEGDHLASGAGTARTKAGVLEAMISGEAKRTRSLPSSGLLLRKLH